MPWPDLQGQPGPEAVGCFQPQQPKPVGVETPLPPPQNTQAQARVLMCRGEGGLQQVGLGQDDSAVQQEFRSALADHQVAGRLPVHGGHPLSQTVKGKLVDPRECLDKRSVFQAKLLRCDDQGGLRRIA